ncbi:hypothetical protein, partial [Conchiformibius steedae]|uniref:hypothetical protein n=1 Tax=Conchiformibius steedae TaxID=153493 RepID=UPI0026EEBA03
FIAPLFANVLYWVVLLMFWRGKTAAVKTCLRWIWVFAIFGTVAFAVESRPEFGWGALLWFLSFAALTVAVNDRHVSLRQMRLRLAGVTVVAVLSMAAFSAWQWHHANDWERQTYDLPWQAAFTTQALSHLPYQPPPELPPQSRMVLQGDWNGNADIALPKQFAYRGWQVQRFDGEQSDVALLQRLPNSATQPDYQYGVRDGHWFLADAKGNILWQVPRDKMTPLLHSRYHTLWEKQFKQQTLPPEPLVLPRGRETARADCPIAPSAAPFAHAVDWLGHTVLDMGNTHDQQRSAVDYRSYCSPHYAVLMVRAPDGDYPERALVFTREPFRPLFSQHSWMGEQEDGWPDSLILDTPPPKSSSDWVYPEIQAVYLKKNPSDKGDAHATAH